MLRLSHVRHVHLQDTHSLLAVHHQVQLLIVLGHWRAMGSRVELVTLPHPCHHVLVVDHLVPSDVLPVGVEPPRGSVCRLAGVQRIGA